MVGVFVSQLLAIATGVVAALFCAATALLAAVDYTQVWIAAIAAIASIANTYMLTRVRKEHKEIQQEVHDTKAKIGASRRESDC